MKLMLSAEFFNAWFLLQNDLVHGWGLDFALRRCVEVTTSLNNILSKVDVW